jgi:hypothetical protein
LMITKAYGCDHAAAAVHQLELPCRTRISGVCADVF